jgi:predicted DNA-binding protein with PD1-like motif
MFCVLFERGREMSGDVYKLYIPAGNWLVETLTNYCMAMGIGNCDVTGIGSIGKIWTMVDPNGTAAIKLSDAEPSYEMTSLVGNVTLRQGIPLFDQSQLPSGKYPQFDPSVQTYNCFVHAHVTFADSAMTIRGGHLLDAWVTIGAELVLRTLAGPDCVPGLTKDAIPLECVADETIGVPPFGTFCNWGQNFWFPGPPARQSSEPAAPGVDGALGYSDPTQ